MDSDPGAADRGSIIHNAIDKFLGEVAGDLPAGEIRDTLAAAFSVAS